jgi:hypothetical protein
MKFDFGNLHFSLSDNLVIALTSSIELIYYMTLR